LYRLLLPPAHFNLELGRADLADKVMNFTAPAGVQLATGSYVNVLVTGSFPNSLVASWPADRISSGDRVIWRAEINRAQLL